MSEPYDYTTRIVDLDDLSDLDREDLFIVVDRSDLSASPEGTEKAIKPRTLVEQSPVRPSTNLTVEKTMSEWVGEFSDSLETIESSVRPSSPTQSGIVRLAGDSEAVNKERDDVALTPKNLDALGASEDVAGLLRVVAPALLMSSQSEDRMAVTPKALFDGFLADSTVGSSSFVFKLPFKDVDGSTLRQLTIQYGEREANSTPTDNRPESNFNHNHPFIDIGVTFPQPFETRCLMVIPMGYNVNDSYEEGTEFVFREFSSSESSAVIRGSRIEGVNTSGERVGVKYIAIGY